MSDEFKVARDFLLANRAAYDVVRQGVNGTRKLAMLCPSIDSGLTTSRLAGA
jgi:hypothetical protein